MLFPVPQTPHSLHTALPVTMLLQQPGTRTWTGPARRGRPRTATAALGRRTVLGGLGTGLCCCSGCSCSHRSQSYDKYFAYSMAVGMTEYEAAIRPVKQALFKQLFSALQASSSSSSSAGPVSLLEVGIGTGPNLPLYTPFSSTSSSRGNASALDLSITGLDPNAEMQAYAQRAALAAGLQQQQLQLVEGDAQQMPFDSDSFDAAVMTLVLCSVPQPQAVLSELLRVLKPGGQLLLIEHVIAPQLGLLQLQQRLLDPLQQLLADNCHLTRDTAAAVRATSFVPQPLPPLPLKQAAAAAGGGGGMRDGVLSAADAGPPVGSSSSSSSGLMPGAVNGSVDLWRFEVDGMGLIAPHVAGLLTKPLV